MIAARGYIFSRPFLGDRVPQHIQNLVIRDYCQRNNLHFLLSATEYAMPGCYLILNEVVEELNSISGIVSYSLFQLPEIFEQRALIYKKVIDKNKTFHFALEGLSAHNSEEFERIEMLWRVRLALKDL